MVDCDSYCPRKALLGPLRDIVPYDRITHLYGALQSTFTIVQSVPETVPVNQMKNENSGRWTNWLKFTWVVRQLGWNSSSPDV